MKLSNCIELDGLVWKQESSIQKPLKGTWNPKLLRWMFMHFCSLRLLFKLKKHMTSRPSLNFPMPHLHGLLDNALFGHHHFHIWHVAVHVPVKLDSKFASDPNGSNIILLIDAYCNKKISQVKYIDAHPVYWMISAFKNVQNCGYLARFLDPS